MSTSTSLPSLYEEKQNIQEQPEIPRINKVTAEDMNIIRELLENCLFKDNENIKDIDGNILDLIIPRYSYNLITDGPAVKTGRKVDDKWEWVKRVSISTNSGENLKNVYLPLNIYKILNIKCMAISNSSNSFKMPSVDAALCNIFVRNNGFLDLNMGTGNFEQGSAEVEIFFREI